jgi:hypothetical protein
MVRAGLNTRRDATGSRTRAEMRSKLMNYCAIPAINATTDDPKPCTGHLSKFADCLAETLWEMTLDGGDQDAGSADFEGHVSLLVVVEPEPGPVIEAQGDRQVMVPTDNYLVWVATSGAVTITTVDTIEGARAVVNEMDRRELAWEAGCDPDRPGLHGECLDRGECLLSPAV